MTNHIGAAQVQHIMEEVAAKYLLSVTALRAKRRSRCVAWPRQEVMWRAAVETPASYKTIAYELGLKDHTTIIYGIRRHEERMKAQQNG